MNEQANGRTMQFPLMGKPVRLSYMRHDKLVDIYGTLQAIGPLILLQRADGGFVCIPGGSLVDIAESNIVPVMGPVG